MEYRQTVKLKTYHVLQDVFSGDRVPALAHWLRIYPKSNPKSILGEDKDCITAARAHLTDEGY